MENDLIESQFFTAHPEPMWIYDLETLRFLAVNDAAVAHYGYSREEFLALTIADIRPSEDVDALLESVAGVTEGLDRAGLWRHRLKSGEVIDVEIVSHTITHAGRRAEIVLARNATRLVELTRAHATLRTAQRLLGLGFWKFDLDSGHLQWSDEVYTMYGVAPGEFAGNFHAYAALVHPDDREATTADLDAFTGSGERHFSFEHRIVRPAGGIVCVRGVGELTEARGSRILTGVVEDITERRELDERAKQSQKLESIGQLTGGIAHDFNNLLTVILGNAEMLGEQLGDRPELRSLADMTAEAATRGAELTSHLLAFARRQPLAPQRVDVNRLLAGMDSLLRRTLTEEVEIAFFRADGLWPVEVDPGQLEAALLNLVINARDAMPSGGRLTIETANVTLDEGYAARHEDVASGQYVAVSVTDTGAGMPAEVVAQAFDPFFTTKAVGKGSGLGLSMVYGFVRQSGGHAKIYTEVGEGTAVRLYFPRSAGAGAAPEALRAHRIAAGGREHVLVVEDDELVRDHVARQLRDLGYSVTTAGTGPEALDLLDRIDKVDLLFTDVIMPGGMNGRALADAARARRPTLKVLFTSGYTENAFLHQGRLEPGVDLLGKPYRRQDLAAKLRKVLDAPVD